MYQACFFIDLSYPVVNETNEFRGISTFFFFPVANETNEFMPGTIVEVNKIKAYRYFEVQNND